MFKRIAALVFLFLIRQAEVIRSRYGQNTVKKLRKLEKRDDRLRKAQIDLHFLVNCNSNSTAL